MSSGILFVIDDSNLKTINYETPDLWFPSTVPQDEAIDGTLTKGLAGAKANLTFVGSAVAVLGIGSTDVGGPPAVEFTIDGSLHVSATAPNNGSTGFEYPFLDIADLSVDQHSLEIQVINATRNYPFVLDAIVYAPPSGAMPTASQVVYTNTIPSATISVAAQSASHNSSGAPVGAIVGGVVGGVAVLVAAGIAVYLLCFRRRSNGKPYFYASSAKAGDLLGIDEEPKPTPYEYNPQAVTVVPTAGPHSQYGGSSAPTISAHPVASVYAQSAAPLSDYSSGTSTSGPSQPPALHIVTNAPPVRHSPNQPRSKAAEAGLLSIPQPATYHADSGVRFSSTGEPSSSSSAAVEALDAPELQDVPPSYSEA
ncbi:hypothetical protein BD414DRAFT_511460 [Trametes punicea]|nr:hypothetical protein BD414DRAFT_511460 [Trametes punicea]